MEKKHVKDVIKDEYKKWSVGDDVTMNFQTGLGKTTFILDVFAPYLREQSNTTILYLVSRKKLKKHIEDEISKRIVTNITVMTYQDLQNKILNEDIKVPNYTYIICDECHYLIEEMRSYKQTGS